MIDELLGLPAHPLIVHAAVIFGPLLVAAVFAYSLVPMLRRHIGWLVIALAVVGPATLWLARLSGEAFRERQIRAGAQGELLRQISEHQNFGNWAAWTVTVLGVLAVLLVLVCTAAGKKPATPGSRAVTYGLILITLVVGAAAGYYTFKTGHTGATTVWG